MFIQLHSLRSFPPHIPNRGADGLAKRAVFGGHERQRISYQCHQYALRTDSSIEALNSAIGETARSTLVGPRLIEPALIAQGMDEETARTWTIAIMALWGKEGKGGDEDGSTAQPLVVGHKEAEALATMASQLAAAEKEPGDLRALISKRLPRDTPDAVSDAVAACKAILGQVGFDGALFGRMATGVAVSNIRRAVRMSDWLSVHAITPVSDFFSTTDTLKDVGGTESGAGHISTRELGAGTFYQHAVIDLNQLQENLGTDDVSAALTWLLAAMVQVDPVSGRANSRIIEMGVQIGPEQPRSFMDAYVDPVMPAAATTKLHEFADQQADLDGLGKPAIWLSEIGLSGLLGEVQNQVSAQAA